MSSRIEDFFINADLVTEETKEVIISNRFKDQNGDLIPFKIKTISEEENRRIKEKSNVIGSDQFKRKTKDLDSSLYQANLIVACTIEPNFKSSDLQARHKFDGNSVGLVRFLLRAGEFNKLVEAILEFNGFLDNDLEEVANEIKN